MYKVYSNIAVGPEPSHYEDVLLGTFDTYEESVAFCKTKLDELRDYLVRYNNDTEFAMARDYDPDDAFRNGGGDLRIEPERPGQEFSAAAYFYRKS